MKKPEPPSVLDVLHAYELAGCPDTHLRPLVGESLFRAKNRCGTIAASALALLPAADLRQHHLDGYLEWRTAHTAKESRASTDADVKVLCRALRYAVRTALLDANPLPERQRFQPSSEVRHCRETMPSSADEVHAIARWCFEKGGQTQVYGWAYLLQAYTGLRMSEVIELRWDATPGQPGYVQGDLMTVARLKVRGVVPFVRIHPELRELLVALAAWNDIAGGSSPWLLPRFADPSKPICARSYQWALEQYSAQAGKVFTSHGARAFYVTVRRAQGIQDPQISAEIGQTSGGIMITQVYGGIPTSWISGQAPQLSWSPADGSRAWRKT